ncbi:MAG: serine/threonine protein kinase [Gemmatimonadetes bacterium]|nr:serine/threonine protein kinase [Gemmatimonadota bacterium]
MTTLDPEHLIGRSVGPYTVERLIGQGGFAWVFAARNDTTQPVALKILRPRYSGDKQFESRFRNESNVASELRHPNIVQILDVGQDGDITYFAMDLYPDSLASRLQRDGPLPEADLLRTAAEVGGALAFAHERGIIHRDIKVDNILYRADGGAVVTDFGIARAVSGYASATGVNMMIGTPHYVSPEQAQGRPLDGRSDLYALGVTLYKAATGELPFRSTDWFELARMHVEDTPEAPRARRPEISRRFERIILKCLAKHPDDRYASAAEFVNEVRDMGNKAKKTEQFGAIVISEKTQPPPPVRRTPVWMLLAGAVIVVALVAAAVVVLAKR